MACENLDLVKKRVQANPLKIQSNFRVNSMAKRYFAQFEHESI
jgi:hypothetical protein